MCSRIEEYARSRGYASEEAYYREEFGGGPCPVCGETLDEAGRRHADGTPCPDAITTEEVRHV